MSALWGVPYLLIKVTVAELDPAFVVWSRLLMSAAVRRPISAFNGTTAPTRHYAKQLVFVAVVGLVAPFLLIAYGEQHISSSLAALLIAADPLFIVLLAIRFDLAERAGGARLLGLVVGFVGVGALVGLNPGGDALGLLGSVMLLGAAVCYAASALVVKRLSGSTMVASSAVTLSIAAVLLLPLGLSHLPTAPPSAQAIVSLLGLS